MLKGMHAFSGQGSNPFAGNTGSAFGTAGGAASTSFGAAAPTSGSAFGTPAAGGSFNFSNQATAQGESPLSRVQCTSSACVNTHLCLDESLLKQRLVQLQEHLEGHKAQHLPLLAEPLSPAALDLACPLAMLGSHPLLNRQVHFMTPEL